MYELRGTEPMTQISEESDDQDTTLLRTLEEVNVAAFTLDENLVIVGWNMEATHLYGLFDDEVCGREFERTFKIQEPNISLQLIIEETLIHGNWKGNITQIITNGPRLNIELSVKKIPRNNQMRYLVVARDLNQLEQQKKREESFRIQSLHYELIHRLIKRSHGGASIKDLACLICDELKVIHSLNFSDFWKLENDSEKGTFAKLIYSNINLGVIDKVESLTGLTFKNYRIPLFDGGLYRELYDRKRPILCHGRTGVTRAIRDMVDPKRKALRAFAGQTARIAGHDNIYLVPLVVQNKTVGHIGFNHIVGFTEAEKEAIALIADKIATIIERRHAESIRDDLENQLRQAQKMEAIGRLAGGIAHDFNNILTGISGNISLVLMDLDNSDPLYDRVSEVHDASRRAASLTRQLLTFSRKQITEPRIMNINELLSDVKNLLARVIGEHIELSTVEEPEIWTVEADPGQLEQVLINLAVNARDAMKRGGKLAIQTENVVLDKSFCKTRSYVSPGSYVMIRVMDTGKGMDKKTLEFIFEPFFTTKKPDEGTGLGLSIVFGIVKQHRGFIEVSSQKGRGSSFEIYLPKIDKKPASPLPTAEEQDLPEGQETILVVEDEVIVKKAATRVLKRLGYQVIDTLSPFEALSYFEKDEQNIDLVLTDIVMPGMNGHELAEKIREIFPEIKVIFTSGYSEQTISNHGSLQEGIDFISKPYSASHLAYKIREVLDRDGQDQGRLQ